MLRYDQKKLGLFLKKAREKADFSPGDVARQMGYTSNQLISNIERGVCVTPIDTLAKMVRMYGANPRVIERIILESQREFLSQKLIEKF